MLRAFKVLAILVGLVWVPVGIYALTDPSFEAQLAHLALLWLAVPGVIGLVIAILSVLLAPEH